MTAVPAAPVAVMAVMPFPVVMMMADCVGVVHKAAVEISPDNVIGVAGCSRQQFDAGFLKRHASAAADTAADQRLHLSGPQKSG